MYRQLIINDIRKTKPITATIAAFVLIAAMLTSLAVMLAINLFSAIDNLFMQARTPHVLQMHMGDIDKEELQHFANVNSNVEAFQILEYLNIDGAKIVIGGQTLAWSMQRNGFQTQSTEFDFLLDLNNEIANPSDGEVYVPIYYMREGAATIGDTLTIHGVYFTVAGFLRDSQMNAALVSSKRFLISGNDFERIRDIGTMQYLIEFRLHDTSQTSAFVSNYLNAGLPANGPPTITYAQIRVINAVTDGIMIAVLILVSLLVIIVAFLCIRFTLLAKIEDDYREIGVLKAVGLRVSHIKKLYMAKYGAITGIACFVGLVLSFIIKNPFMQNIRLYMGESNREFSGILFGLAGAVIIFAIIMLYVSRTLRRFRKISAAQAVRFGAPQEKSKSVRGFTLSRSRLFSSNVFLGIQDVLSRKKLYATMLMVLIISAFIMNVPYNIHNTISSRSFTAYMGVGQCDAIIEVSAALTDDVTILTNEIAAYLTGEPDVYKYTVITCRMFGLKMDDGTIQRMRVELGDHSIFPIVYYEGRMPQTNHEIALSVLYANELERTVGDEILLIIDSREISLTVSGIYSDITSGGMTAKAIFETDAGEVLWSSIPVVFHDNVASDDKIDQLREMFPTAKVLSIGQYLEQTFGSTIAVVQVASYISIAVAIALTMLITVLFMKMLVTKDRHPIAILKSLGFSVSSIKTQYKARGVIVLIPGVIIGVILSMTLGESLAAMFISFFGVSAFRFEVSVLFSWLLTPLLLTLCVYISTAIGISDLRRLKVSEHIKEV